MIEVFKTNVQEAEQSQMIVRKLLEHFPGSTINFDLEDCDKILRVYAPYICNHTIMEILRSHGYQCDILL